MTVLSTVICQSVSVSRPETCQPVSVSHSETRQPSYLLGVASAPFEAPLCPAVDPRPAGVPEPWRSNRGAVSHHDRADAEQHVTNLSYTPEKTKEALTMKRYRKFR